MTVAVLALQGAFIEHEQILNRLGVEHIELRQTADLKKPFDALILLASEIEGQEASHFATLPVKVKRNAYGRQLGSFHTESEVKGIGKVPMTFIRAPYVSETAPNVEVLAVVDGKIVGVHYGSQFAYAFHPELDDDTQIHELFLKSISAKS